MSSLGELRWRSEGMREGYIRKDRVNARLHGERIQELEGG